MTAGARDVAIALAIVAAILNTFESPGGQAPTSPWPVSFTDIAAAAGLGHPSIYGGVDRKRFIIETNGAGVALVDVDRDGWLDAFVLSGTRLADNARSDATHESGRAPTNRLYRNKRDGTFEEVTAAAGLARTGWASGVCAGDYDNDGWTDLFVTYFGSNVLYRNRGDGRFEDATAAAGLAAPGIRWGSGCTFVDVDRDGRLDLFVANYLRFDLQTAPEPGSGPNCTWKGIAVNCGPKGLPTDTNLLYRNAGGGRFTDISSASGIARVTGRYSMTAFAADLNGDDWQDIYVASDSTASILYRNNRDGTFTDVALESGTAFNEHGNPQAGMGVAVGDYNNDGLLDIARTHFADDIPALYRNMGKGLFEDSAVAAGLNVQNRYVEWGAALTDFDNDGFSDLLYVTGHVYPEIERLLEQYPHRGPRVLFRNLSRRAIRRRDRAQRSRDLRDAFEPRRRVRRRRQRRRRGRARHEHERAAVAPAQRRARRARVDRDRARRARVESIGDRRDGRRVRRRQASGARGAESIELLLARRAAAPLRARRVLEGGGDRDPLAVGARAG